MYAVCIRVDRVLDFGAIVTLIGIDLETEKPVAVHVDLRRFGEAGQPLPLPLSPGDGLPPPIMYDAGGCTLTLNRAPADADEAYHG